ncbi:hypothetical protein [Massilia luteola]|uniref:hypothetical protein n=1 Tax=Massilia luteola TaxID=3081751 RepID=UPI002ACBDD5A|nr:hypothetical protein [Massilia sp. Gc5]
MSSLSTLGVVHTVISLVAVGAGIAGFIRDGRIDSRTRHGKLYVVTTALTCLSGFFIFAHGGFGKPHALGVATLAVLALALAAERGLVFGRAAARTATVAYSLTFYFHLIPAVTETSTRLPVHAPLVASAESPVLAVVFGLMFLVFLAGVRMQLRRPDGHIGKASVRGATP